MKFLIILAMMSTGTSPCWAQQEIKIDREEVRDVIKTNLKSISSCYDEALKNKPKMEGKVVVEWDITSTGSVGEAGIKSSTLSNEAVEKCIVQKIKELKFPASPRGSLAHIAYPFYFKAKK